MPIPGSLRRWLHLPGRVALMLGLGALSVASPRADAPGDHQRAGPGDVLIRSEGGKIYLSEGGKEFEQVELKDTPEAEHLKKILERNNTAAGSGVVRLNPAILAGGGGSGFHWWGPAEKTDAPEKANPPGKSGKPEKAGAPGKTETTSKKG